MDYVKLSDKILRRIVETVAEEMIEELRDMSGNVAENLSYDDAYNKTDLSNEELIRSYRRITARIISSIRSRFGTD